MSWELRTEPSGSGRECAIEPPEDYRDDEEAEEPAPDERDYAERAEEAEAMGRLFYARKY